MKKAKTKLTGRGGGGRGQGRKTKYICKTEAIRIPILAIAEIEPILRKYLKAT